MIITGCSRERFSAGEEERTVIAGGEEVWKIRTRISEIVFKAGRGYA